MISTQSRERNIPRHEKRFIKTKLLTEKLKEWWMQRNEIKTGEQKEFMGEEEFEEKFLKLQLNYNERLQSFVSRGWSKGVSMSKLAECGFCFTGVDDIVVCFSCKGKLKDWDSCHVPLVRHLKIYPRCKFAKSLSKRAPKVGLTFDSPRIKVDESTTPCVEEELEDYFKSEFNRLMSFRKCSLSSHVDPYEFAAAGLYYLRDWSENGTSAGEQHISHHCCISVDYNGNVSLTDEERKQAQLFFPQVEKRSSNLKAIAVDGLEGGSETIRVNENHKYPVHPKYADKNERLRTFKGCDSPFQVPVESLAEAGFFSADFIDEVVCFCCGGKLDNWVSQDNPWEEHARNFPDCPWILDHIPHQSEPGGYMSSWKSRHDLYTLQSRISSFLQNGWSLPILVSELAEAGFFHSGETNTTECISCHVKINDWKDTDNPLQKHQTKSPNCEIVKALTEDGEFPHNTTEVFSKVDVDNETELTDECEVDSASSLRKIGSSLLPGDKKRDNEKFKSEYQRLLSYYAWPIRCIVDPFDLASAGFYWRDFERSVTVKCFACYGEISEWQIGEKPYRKHEKLYPSCPFINNLETGNKELTEAERNKVSSLFRKEAEAASHPEVIVEERTSGHKEVRRGDSDNKDVDNFHIQRICSTKIPLNHTSEDSDGSQIQKEISLSQGFHESAAKYPQFLKKKNRLDSFVNWPSNHCQRPEDLATAGFFYKGKKDLVVCFQCGGKLLDWERDDNPWDEHALHYPQCQWLLKEKGMKFIYNIQKKYDTSEDLKESHSPEKDQNPASAGTNITLADKTKPIVGKTSLLDEIEKLKERSLCKICLDDDVELLFLPCKHLVVCAECGGRIESCPICRSYADEKVRVFMP